MGLYIRLYMKAFGRAVMSNSGSVDDIEPPIEVGKADDEIRLWKATEAMRQGELRLTAQALNLAAMESRATSLLGWAVAGTFALGATSISSNAYHAAALAAAVALMGSGLVLLNALWPKPWGFAGYPPAELLDETLETELEIRESIAKGYDKTALRNDKRLSQFGRYLSSAWILFFCAAPAGLVVATITH